MSTGNTDSAGVLRTLRNRKRSRGFTLIELMLVVVIIGVLSSFAIPYFQRFSSRARRSEINQVLDKMHVFFINAYENNGIFPDPGGTVAFNPPCTPVAAGFAGAWSSSALGWNQMPFTFDGGLKLRYKYVVNNATNPPSMTITVVGDMPGFGPSLAANSALSCPGNYSYTEVINGATVMPATEVPAM